MISNFIRYLKLGLLFNNFELKSKIKRKYNRYYIKRKESNRNNNNKRDQRNNSNEKDIRS